MPTRPHRRIAALTALLMTALACSSAGDAGDPPLAEENAAGAPIEGAASGDQQASPAVTGGPAATGLTAEVLRFSAPRLGGGTLEGRDFSGRDVAFWFWAPW